MSKIKKLKKIFIIIMAITLFIIINEIINCKEVQAATGYTTIDSQKIFDKSSLDTLKLNITSLPEITVDGNKSYTLKDEDGKRKVIYDNAQNGENIDSKITVKFNNCGILNSRNVDIKIVYSNIVSGSSTANPNKAIFYWTAYGTEDNQINSNEWWYGGVEKVDVEISFFYHGENSPINLESAYLSIYSEDVGEGISAKEAHENYLYNNTTVQYHQENYKSENATGTYSNLFVGGGYGSTEADNKEKVGFRYQNKTSLKLTLYGLSSLKDVGYHFRYTPLTGVVPDNPTKTVNKTKAQPGEEITYEIKQNLLKRYDPNFNYTQILFSDKLDNNLEFVSFKIEFSTGTEISQSQMELQGVKRMGEFKYDSYTNQITWKEDMKDIIQQGENAYSLFPLQMMVSANGGWMKFIIKAKIKESKTEGNITNKSSIEIQNQYNLESNTVTTNIEKEQEPPVLQKGTITVHYIDKNTGTELDKDIKEGNVNTEITTTDKQIPNYTLVQRPNTEKYTFKENNQDVYYYYAKNTKVIVKYIDKISNSEIAQKKEITGYEGKSYGTEKQEIENYSYVEDTGNTNGLMGKEETTVIYYYKYKGTIKVHHIDEITKKELDNDTLTGLEQENTTTQAKDIPNYKLSKKPETEEYEFSKIPQDVYYYYTHISAGIVVKHIDIITDELLEDEDTFLGLEGDDYEIGQKSFKNYTLVKTSGNTSGKMTIEPIEVKFYYIYNTKIIVHHIYGTNGGEDVEERLEHEGDKYTTNPKDNPIGHDNKIYKLDEKHLPENQEGTLTKKDVEIKYYYIPIAGKATVKHLDKVTKEPIAETKIIEGWTGDTFTTFPIEDPDYVLEEVPKNANGVLTENAQEIIYYYLKKANVTINYIDVITDEVLKTEQIQGVETEKYTTNPQDFEGYDLCIDKYPTNSEGVFTRNLTTVNYYYIYKSKATVKHIDKTTGKTLEEEKIEGHEGDSFTTSPKNMEFYKLSKEPKSRTSTLTKEQQEIIYYYEPLLFNMKVDQIINKILLDNEETIVNGKLGKTEVNRKLSKYNVKIYYTIKVTNNMEIAGNTWITDYIPDGFMAITEENPNWNINEKLATILVENLKPGETREYNIILTNSNKSITGVITNNVIIDNSTNNAGYEETTYDDNKSKTETILGIATGKNNYLDKIFGIIFTIFTSICIIIYKLIKK